MTTNFSLPIRAKPYRHQVDAYHFVCNLFGIAHDTPISRGAALLMEMGTGKTITSIAIAGALYHAEKACKMLIVAPLSILGVWEEEFAKFANFTYAITILTGTLAQKREQLFGSHAQGLQVVVVNYESAWRMEDALLRWDADFIVADEGHKIKTHNISASKAMHRLGAKARYRLLLTGTIITNKAIDVFSPYKFLNPAIFGSSFYAFRNRYFDMVGYGNHTPVLKKHMETDLTDRLHSIAYRATKAECLDLPDTVEIVRHVALEASAQKIYRSLVKDSYAELDKGDITVTNILTRLLRLSQLTGGFIGSDACRTAQQISCAKLNALSDILDSSLADGQKTVVVARFVPEIDAICKMLTARNLRYSLIKGGVKDRAAQVEQFQQDADVSVFVGQIATAGLGITLTAAKTMVFYSLDYSMSNFEQTKARIHRVGQKQDCTYLYLIAQNTVDEKVLNALRQKANLAKMLVDETRHGINPFQ
ncbi:MAG: DEAD/DEAH box helicase [Ruthenibacterium sp.]